MMTEGTDMKKLTLLILMILLLSASLIQADEGGTDDSLYIEWIKNFDDAQALGLSENRIILLDFYADW